jgi:hypothetical protein
MRTRQRLIELLPTVNPRDDHEPVSPWAAGELRRAAKLLADPAALRASARAVLLADLAYIARHNASPHFRELAAETLAHLAEQAA